MSEPDRLAPGDIVVDRYRITAKLGAGGFGATYSAHDLESNQLVAVKALDLAHVNDWKSVELFRREAAVLRALDHPQIPDYIDFVDIETNRAGYLIQTLAPGQSLARHLSDGRRFSQEECLDIARQTLAILAYLHGQSPPMVHRDVKPANLILDAGGKVHLVDFGAVRELIDDGRSGSTMVGTLGYMAPEQLQGEASPTSDIYALGMTLVHLVTRTDPAMLPKRRLKPDFSNAHVEPAFAFVLDKMLEAVPEDRLSSAAEALELLGATSVVHVSDVVPSDGLDELVQQRNLARAEEERERQRMLVERRAEVARKRAEQRPSTVIRSSEAGLTLDYHPALSERLYTSRMVAVVVGMALFVALFGLIALGYVQDWHPAVLANVAVWAALGGFGGLYWALGTMFSVRREVVCLRINPQGNFMVYRNERRPLAYGHKHELEVDVWAPDADSEFGSARICVQGTTFQYDFERLSEADIAVFRQFIESAGLPS